MFYKDKDVFKVVFFFGSFYDVFINVVVCFVIVIGSKYNQVSDVFFSVVYSVLMKKSVFGFVFKILEGQFVCIKGRGW